MGMFLVSNMSKELAWYMSPILAFLDLPECSPVQHSRVLKIFIIWHPYSHFESYVDGNVFLHKQNLQLWTCEVILFIVWQLSVDTDILSCQCKSISKCFEVKDTFFIYWVSDFRQKEFSEMSQRVSAKEKNGLSMEWMPRSILNWKPKVVMYLPHLVYCVCVF